MKPQVGHEVSSIEPVQEGTITLVGASSRYIVKNKDGSFCFGPSPDATFTDSMGTSLGLTLVDTSTSSSDSMEDAHSRSGLGGRNPNILITREILFETCLLVERAKLSPSQMVELYKTTLDAIVKINQRTLDGAAITSDNSEASSLSVSDGAISESSSSTDTSSTD